MKNYKRLKDLAGFTRNDVVDYYAALISDHRAPSSETERINAMILEKWSPHALNYIKTKAWKIVDPAFFKSTIKNSRPI